GQSRAHSGELRGAAAGVGRRGGGAGWPLHVTGNGWAPQSSGVEAAGLADAEAARRSSPSHRGDRTRERGEPSGNRKSAHDADGRSGHNASPGGGEIDSRGGGVVSAGVRQERTAGRLSRPVVRRDRGRPELHGGPRNAHWPHGGRPGGPSKAAPA